MRAQGKTYSEIARALNTTKDTVQKIGRRAKLPESPPRPTSLPPEMAYSGNALVLNDLHGLLLRWDLFRQAVRRARRAKIDQCLLVGDLFNFDMFSVYPKLAATGALHEEIEMAKLVLAFLLRHFETVALCRGNHDARFIQATNGEVNMDMIGDLIAPSKDRDRLHLTPYDRMWLDTPEGLWMLCHQHEYSRNPLVVANKLAQKYQCHILTTHQHGYAVGMDTYKRYTLVDAPCICEDAHYKRMNTSSMPNWARGYTLIVEGKAQVYVEGASLA